MRLDLCSQIALNSVPEEFYNPKTAVERSEITRLEKLSTDIYTSPERGAQAIVDVIEQEIKQKYQEGRHCVLGLGTGVSLTPVFNELIRRHKEEGLSFKNVIVFNAYEYFPLNKDSQNSTLNQLKSRLLDHIDIEEKNVFAPDGTISQDEVQQYCRLYEQNIKNNKPLLKLTNKDYNENGLSELLALYGSAYNANIKVFNDLQHTITGWPGGKPNADDTNRPERATPFPKRVIVFSPHPDDDVISMGGTLRRLVQQGHDVHVVFETSGNIAVGDEEVTRFMHFINGFNQLFADSKDEVITKKYQEIKQFLANKKDGDLDTRDILTIKGLIRRGEARTASTYNGIPLDHVHFLDLPFYESGKIEKLEMGEKDVRIVQALLQEVQPHQIYVAGDLADPHGTHRKCTNAVFAAVDEEKKAKAAWLKDCRIWMYRGAWAEWEIENIEMCVPMSPEELRAKRNAILKHSSQMESAPFLGNDERLFWQRSEARNRATAELYDKLGLACYEAMEAFVEYKPL